VQKRGAWRLSRFRRSAAKSRRSAKRLGWLGSGQPARLDALVDQAAHQGANSASTSLIRIVAEAMLPARMHCSTTHAARETACGGPTILQIREEARDRNDAHLALADVGQPALAVVVIQ
jgi:hypothetical protein